MKKKPCRKRLPREPDLAHGLVLRENGDYDTVTFPIGRGAADLARILGVVLGGTVAAIPVKDDSSSFIVFDAQGSIKGKKVNRAASLMTEQILVGDCIVCPNHAARPPAMPHPPRDQSLM
jgi:hypothetical protein